jgi:hypoxanthine phosphoribosyltransferase
MKNDLANIMIDENALRGRIQTLADEINRDYQGGELVMICILRGAIMFYADLIRNIDVKVVTAFMAVSSYGSGTHTSGSIRLSYDLDEDITGKDVLIIEDIIDSGLTIQYLIKSLSAKGPKSIKTCCLLDKPSRRIVDYKPDYTGFEIEDGFVVGFGLDYDEKYRNLDVIGILKEEIYS